MDLSDTIHTATTEREVKKRWKNQLLARSLHSCPRSQVRKWVDEDDQKFLLMKCVNDVGADVSAPTSDENCHVLAFPSNER